MYSERDGRRQISAGKCCHKSEELFFFSFYSPASGCSFSWSPWARRNTIIGIILINLVISASKSESQWSLITARCLCQISVMQVSVVRMNVSQRGCRRGKVDLLEKMFLSCSEPDRGDNILLLRADMCWPAAGI